MLCWNFRKVSMPLRLMVLFFFFFFYKALRGRRNPESLSYKKKRFIPSVINNARMSTSYRSTRSSIARRYEKDSHFRKFEKIPKSFRDREHLGGADATRLVAATAPVHCTFRDGQWETTCRVVATARPAYGDVAVVVLWRLECSKDVRRFLLKVRESRSDLFAVCRVKKTSAVDGDSRVRSWFHREIDYSGEKYRDYARCLLHRWVSLWCATNTDLQKYLNSEVPAAMDCFFSISRKTCISYLAGGAKLSTVHSEIQSVKSISSTIVVLFSFDIVRRAI